MPPKTTRTGGNKKSSENRKTTLRSSQKDCETSTDPVDVMISEVEETETILKPDKTDTTLQTKDESSQAIKPEKVQSTPVEADTSNQGHQSQQHATDEQTRVAAKTFELLQGTDDPNKASPKEAAYFEGSGLMDHICSSKKRKKGLQSHQTMQQMTADVPTSSMMSIPVKTVLRAKVMVDDLVNFQSRLGSPNTLMAAIKSTSGKMSGTDGTGKDESKHSKKQH